MTDKARGTGRTQNAIKVAMLAALAGRRVLFITHSETFARECMRFAQGQVELMMKIVGQPGPGMSVACTGAAMSVYSAGHLVGKLQFRSTAQQENHDLNTGLRGAEVYAIVKDHYVLELEEEERLRLEKVAAQEQIQLLMKKYGWRSVCRVGQAGRRAYTVDMHGNRQFLQE